MRFLSVCSGIEAASVAWKPLGWTCAGVSEIDAFPRSVLEQRQGAVADGPRYKALGNSMAVPVMAWIGERIAKVDALP